jgi:hypothetical protein
MKIIFAISILLSINFSAKAVEKNPAGLNAHAKNSLKTYPKESLSLERGMTSLSSENIGALSEELCGYFIAEGKDIPKLSKKAIEDHMKDYEGIVSPSKAQMVKFLNHNKNYMTCGKEEKNYMMVSFEYGRAYDELFNMLFFDLLVPKDESVHIDVNAISYHLGKPETVLDFMYREYNDPTNSEGKKAEVGSLIETFEMEPFYAKKHVELLNENEKH